MAKMFVLIPKKNGLSSSSFYHHWRTEHATLAKKINSLSKYSQFHIDHTLTKRLTPLSGSQTHQKFYGISEAWFDSLEAAVNMTRTPEYREGALPDESNFMDTPHKIRLFASTNKTQFSGDEGYAPVKLMLITEPQSHLSQQTFKSEWTRVSPRIFKEFPAVVSHLHWPVDNQAGRSTAPQWATVDEMWWRSEEDLMTDWNAAVSENLFAPLWDLVSEQTLVVVGRENRVIWPEKV